MGAEGRHAGRAQVDMLGVRYKPISAAFSGQRSASASPGFVSSSASLGLTDCSQVDMRDLRTCCWKCFLQKAEASFPPCPSNTAKSPMPDPGQNSFEMCSSSCRGGRQGTGYAPGC